jgi:hypothetical protein
VEGRVRERAGRGPGARKGEERERAGPGQGARERRVEAAREQWEISLGRSLTDCRLAVDREVQVSASCCNELENNRFCLFRQAKKTALEQTQDLGSKFNDPRLNQLVVAGEGEELPIYRCQDRDGTLTFDCTVCSITVAGLRTLESHMAGRKHKARLVDREVLEGAPAADPVAAMAELVPGRGLLSRLLAQWRPEGAVAVPAPGTEFLAEVLLGRGEPEYHCLLCSAPRLSVHEAVPHLLQDPHRLAWLARARPELYLQYAARPDPELWDAATAAGFEGLVSRAGARTGYAVLCCRWPVCS